MKTLFNKKFMTALAAFLFCITVKAQLLNPQLKKIAEMKWKNEFMQHMHLSKNADHKMQQLQININPYWKAVNAPYSVDNSFIPQIQAPTFNSVWAHISFDTGQYFANRFLHTTDEGKTWRDDSVDTPPDYSLLNFSAIDANTCYAAMDNGFTGQDPRIYKTIDGGDTWKQIGAGQVFKDAAHYADFVYFFDAQNGLAVADGEGNDSNHIQIYTTSDAGKTWSRISDKNIPPVTGGVAASLIFNGYTAYKNTIWVRAYDSQGNNYIYRSSDYGHHWQLFSFTLDKSYNDFAFSDYMNGIFVGVAFDGTPSYEAVTHDGGKTWTEITPKGTVMGIFITVIPYTHTYVSTMPYGAPVYGSSYSNDNGKTWTLIDSGVGAEHSDVAFLNPFVGWTGKAESPYPVGGTYKWKYHFSLDNNAVADNANVSFDNAIAITKNNTTSLSAYPNPVSNSLTISFNLQQSQKVSITIYDINGRLIKTLADAQMQQGIHQLIWNARTENIIAGNYLLKLQAGNYSETKKLSVIK